ncbi:MAG TPA: N-acetylglucosamine-6-phosphate deacetylase [Planococcus sp. (in: firmicutes)]|nr:N-acetylglucosamine-6-phosphate deacetylase [Planococcus sp. (in: firmicutes)]
MRILLSNISIVNSDTGIVFGDVFLEEGKIAAIGENLTHKADILLDGSDKDWLLLPGFIDLHTHGSLGFDVMDATSEALSGMARSFPREGTTSFLAATITQSEQAIMVALQNVRNFESGESEAELLGVHLEGPFISPERAGAQPVGHIIEPSLKLFKEWQEASGNRIELVTLAPERSGGTEFIKELTNSGVVVSIGHSDATFEEVQEATEAGARHVTHLYNQMSPFHHRQPGVVGAALLNDNLTVELIADFIHSHEQSVRLAYQQKGAERLILITDAMRAKGLPPGTYDLGGQHVEVDEKAARLSNGRLAGSMLTMTQAAKNIRSVTNCSPAELVAMTSANAARQLGLPHKGRIEIGCDADLVIVDKDLNVVMTFCRGNLAYEREGSK